MAVILHIQIVGRRDTNVTEKPQPQLFAQKIAVYELCSILEVPVAL